MTLHRDRCGQEYAFVRLFDNEQLRGQQSQHKSSILSRVDKSIEPHQQTSLGNILRIFRKRVKTADWGILNLFMGINGKYSNPHTPLALTLCILVDFPIHIDTISMGQAIV